MYNASGKVTNENHVYKVEYDSKMWEIAVVQKNLRNEYGVIEVEKLVDINGNKFENSDLEAEIKLIVKNIHNGSDAPLTEEQKTIAELKEKIETLTKIVSKDKGSDNGLDELRAEYELLSGKKPHHTKSKDQILIMLQEFKNK